MTDHTIAIGQVKEFIESDDSYRDFGLRVMHGKTMPTLGDILPVSRKWTDGKRTRRDLPGTSAIGVKSTTVARAFKSMDPYIPLGDFLVLLAGEIKEHGEDDGEVVLGDAEVMLIFKIKA
jgi:hypothetical protein